MPDTRVSEESTPGRTGFPDASLTNNSTWPGTVPQQPHIVGVDLVEVAPDYDNGDITTTLAAQLLMNFMGFIFEERRKSGVTPRTELTEDEEPETAFP